MKICNVVSLWKRCVCSLLEILCFDFSLIELKIMYRFYLIYFYGHIIFF